MSLAWQHQLVNVAVAGDKNLWTASFEKKTIMIFLRHFGCIFCKNMLSDLARAQNELTRRGFQIIVVHQSDLSVSKEFFNSFGLKDFLEISDPYRSVYQIFEINQVKLSELFHPRAFLSAWQSYQEGHRNGPVDGSVWQMPGLLILFEGKIQKRFEFDHVGRLPIFLEFAE